MNVLQELGGWEPEEMVRRYAHLSKPQLMKHSELVPNILDSTILAPPKNKGQRNALTLMFFGGLCVIRTHDQRIKRPIQ